ncbi:MAG: hypothetical protein C4B57_00585 [Deltaproteobacteria bacterium]|nr:MAG: hypothetical protein C4B57_00585 [Deltaproteobacteria bacterium]
MIFYRIRPHFATNICGTDSKEHTIRDSLEDYKAGIVTLWEAAQRCNLSLWEMVQEVKRAHIHTSYDLKEFKKDLRALNG